MLIIFLLVMYNLHIFGCDSLDMRKNAAHVLTFFVATAADSVVLTSAESTDETRNTMHRALCCVEKLENMKVGNSI